MYISPLHKALYACLVAFATLAAAPCAAQESSPRGLSLKTNLLLWGAGEPNLGGELSLGSHVTLGVVGGLKPWPRLVPWDRDQVENPSHWRNFLLAPELRYYPKSSFTGWFLGLNGLYTHYNVGKVDFPLGLYPAVRNQRLQGDFLGAGFHAGYALWLGAHWRLEALAGLNAGYYRAETFDCAWCGAKTGNAGGPAIVPKLGVNLAYHFSAREKARKEVLELLQPEPVVEAEPLPEPPQAVPDPGAWRMPLPGVPDYMGVAGDLAPRHPVLQPTSAYRPYSPDRILRREEGALYVFFELSSDQLKRNFTEGDRSQDNAPVLDEIMELTASILQDTTSRVSCIQIVGLASVEGPEEGNRRLSVGRALALQHYIQERLPVPDSLFETVGGGEAWADFRDIVSELSAQGGSEGLTPAQLQQVLRIVDTEADVNRREWLIKKLEGGKVYKALLPHVLSGLRNSGYVRIYFDYVPDHKARAINAAIEELESGNADEALRQLSSLREDPRSAESYAAALFAAGRESEAVAVLEEAAAAGDEACGRQLRRWQEYSARRAAYEAYLQALNNYLNN